MDLTFIEYAKGLVTTHQYVRLFQLMDPQIIALFGAMLSAILAALAYFFKARRERLRTARTVLYYLLEMRHHLAKAQYGVSRYPAHYLSTVASVCKDKGIVLSDADLKTVELTIKSLIRELSTARIAEISKEVVEPYLRSLAELARDAPVLAYKLKGKEAMPSISTTLSDFMRPVKLGVMSAEDEKMKEVLLTEMDDFDLEMTLVQLGSACRQVAAHCGVSTYIQTRLVMRTQDMATVNTKAKSKEDLMLDALVGRVAEHLKTGVVSSASS